MIRIAVGGFQHETNSFAAEPATWEDFVAADAWPGLVEGEALIDAVAGVNLPTAGFIDRAHKLGHRVVPLAWASAQPSGPVTTDAFERFMALLLDGLTKAMPVEAVYLDLHGAMVTEDLEDAEGEILARVRRLVGPRVPVVASLDLHANVTRRMIEQATALTAYRTYPHVDMAETGARAADMLERILKDGRRPRHALIQADYLIPLPAQATLIDPARMLYDLLARTEVEMGTELSLALGFPAADMADCGPAVMAHGDRAGEAAHLLSTVLAESEGAFGVEMLTVAEAVRRAVRRAQSARRPVILADTQDNPGGGAASDGVALIEALLDAQAESVVIGLLADAKAAATAHEAGIGSTLEIGIGAGSGYGGARPLYRPWTVEALGEGAFTGTGPFYGGNRMQLGPMAVLRHGGVRVVVSSRKQQAADQAMFRHVGLEPARAKILVLKSSVHFRADFGPIADEVIVALAPGPNRADPAELPFHRLRPGVRLRPLGPAFAPPE